MSDIDGFGGKMRGIKIYGDLFLLTVRNEMNMTEYSVVKEQ